MVDGVISCVYNMGDLDMFFGAGIKVLCESIFKWLVYRKVCGGVPMRGEEKDLKRFPLFYCLYFIWWGNSKG